MIIQETTWSRKVSIAVSRDPTGRLTKHLAMSGENIDKTEDWLILKGFQKRSWIITFIVIASMTIFGTTSAVIAIQFKEDSSLQNETAQNFETEEVPRPMIKPENSRKQQSVLHWIVKDHFARRFDVSLDEIQTWGDNIYLFQTEKLLQSEATDFCRQKRMALAQINSRQENDWLADNARKMTATYLNKIVNPSWPQWWAELVKKPYRLWRVGRHSPHCGSCFENWSHGSRMGHHCVAVSLVTRKWEPIGCHFLALPFVCKAKLSTVLK